MDRAIFEISVGGVNVSEKFDPILQHLNVEGRSGGVADAAELVLSDVDGQILMPSRGNAISIALGWQSSGITSVFTGTVERVQSHGSREGRTLVISAKSFDTGGKAKEHLEFHKDNAGLQDFMSEAAGRAGLSFATHPSLAQIQRPYWAAARESFIQLGTRVAREVGAGFKIIGATAYMWPRNSGLFGAGDSGGAITATWGDNLIDWAIAPAESRTRFAQSRACWYDPKQAKWLEQIQAIEITGALATYTHPFTRADGNEAGGSSTSNQQESEREAGSGTVTIIGEPAAQADGTCAVVGARPGVDGVYRIDTYSHDLSREGGFTTQLELRQPQGSAGTDDRGGSGDGSSSVGGSTVNDVNSFGSNVG